jgi:hypothetical protein
MKQNHSQDGYDLQVYPEERPIACLAWCSAPRHPGPRDRFIA